MRKRLLNITLALLMTLTLLPSKYYDTSAETVDSVTNDDGVTLTKRAERVEGHLNRWKINLGVEFTPEPMKKDIILVIDKSGSMGKKIYKDGPSRMSVAKEAASNFIELMLDPTKPQDNRIAIIEYSSGSKISHNFDNNVENLKKTVDNIKQEGATFTQAALRQAEILMQDKRVDADPVVVVLTDGAATLGYGLSKSGLNKMENAPQQTLVEKDINGEGKFVALGKFNNKNWKDYYKYIARYMLKDPFSIAEGDWYATPSGGERERNIPFVPGKNKWYLSADDVEKSFSKDDFDYTTLENMGGSGFDVPFLLYKYNVNGKTVTGNVANKSAELKLEDKISSKSSFYFINLLNTMIAESRILKEETGADIYTVALGLGDDDPLAEKAVEEMADPGKFFSDDGSKLVEYFAEIADELMFPLEHVGLKTFDPMGEAVDLLEQSLEHIKGKTGGIEIDERSIKWDMTKDSFEYNPETKSFFAEISYEVVLNEKAFALLEENPELDIDTNGDAFFEYTKDGDPKKEFFPKPKVKPAVLKLSKELLDESGEKISLEDDRIQRAYHYDLDLNDDGFYQESLTFNEEQKYHLFQTMETVTLKETHVLHDDIAKYDIKYLQKTDEGLIELEVDESGNALFKLEEDSGLNHIIIQNKIKEEYEHTDFEVSKNVRDENKNDVAEIGEQLTYQIEVKNNQDIFMRDLTIKDDLKDISAFLQEYKDNNLRVSRDGKTIETDWTIADLQKGILTHLDKSETLLLEFDVRVIDSKELPEKLINTAYANEKEATSTIDVVLPQFEAKKTVLDGNGNGFAEAGETLNYTIEVKNTGTVVIPKVKVQDDLAKMIDFVTPESIAEGVVYHQGTTTTLQKFIDEGIFLEDIPVDGVEKVEFSVKLLEDLDVDAVKNIENIASVDEEKPKVEIETAKPIITSHKNVVIENDKAIAEAGDVLTYTITAKNSGKVKYENFNIKDDLKQMYPYLDETYLENNNEVLILAEDGTTIKQKYTLTELAEGIHYDLDANETIQVQFKVKLKENLDEILDDKVKIENMATVGPDEPFVEVPFGKPILSSSKTLIEEFEDNTIEPGESLTYVIKVENSGSVAKENLFIQDNMDQLKSIMHEKLDELTYDITINDQTETKPLRSLHDGFTINLPEKSQAEVRFSFTVKDNLDVEKVKEVENVAIVDEDRPSIKVETGKAELVIDKTVTDENRNQYAEANERLDYLISIENIGTVTKRDVFIQDTLEHVLPYVQNKDLDVTMNGEALDMKDLQKGFKRDIAAKEKVEIKFSVQLKADLDTDVVENIFNLATVDNETPKVTIPTGAPKIVTSKKVTDDNENGFAEAGEVLNYEIVIENQGEVSKEAVFIQDDLKNLMDIIEDPRESSFIMNGESYAMTQLLDGFEKDIAAQEVITIKFSVQVKESFDADDLDLLVNTVKVDDVPTSAKIPSGKPRIQIDKTVKDESGDHIVENGEMLNYEIVVKNKGEVGKDDVFIQDELAQLKDYIVDFADAVFTMNDTTYPLNDLVSGITVPMEAHSELVITFSVKVDGFDVATVRELVNTATADDETSTTKIPTGEPVIVAKKEVFDENNDGRAEAGEKLTYKISFENAGNVVYKDLFIQDTLADLLAHVEDISETQFTMNDTSYPLQKLVDGFTLDLKAQEKVEIEFDLVVKEDFDAKTIDQLENIATVGPEEPKVTIPSGYSELKTKKFVTDENRNGFAEANELLHYHIKIENIGNVVKKDVFIQDDLADILLHVQDIKDVTFDLNGESRPLTELINGFKMDVSPTEVVHIKFSLQLKEDFNADLIEELANLAVVDEETPKANIPSGKPDIVAYKFVEDENQNGHAEKGEILNYRIRIHNNGKVREDQLFVQDSLAEILPYVEDIGDSNFTYNGKTEKLQKLVDGFTMPIEAGETIMLSFSVKVKEDLDVDKVPALENIAVVGENTPSIKIPTGEPKIEAHKTVRDANGDEYVEAGETLTYELVVTNKGEVSDPAVRIQDDLAQIAPHIQSFESGVMYVDDMEKPLSKLVNGFTMAIDPEQVVTIRFDVVVKDDFDADEVGELVNTAKVDEETPTAKIQSGKPRIDSQKHVVDENGNGYAEAGENLTYTITIRNTGEVAQKALKVQDDLKELLPYLDRSSFGEMYVDGEARPLTDLMNGFTLDIDSGETIQIEFTVRMRDDFDADMAKELINIATVGEETPTTPIPSGKPRITATKLVDDANGDGYVEAGERLDYTIKITNHGEVADNHLFIKDDLAQIIDFIDLSTASKVEIRDMAYTIEELQAGIIESIAAHETIEVKFSVTVLDDFVADQNAVLINQAEVGPERPEVEIPSGDAKISALKVVTDENSNDYAEAGERLDYTISIFNKGLVAKRDAMIQDTLADILPYAQSIEKEVVSVNGVDRPLQDLVDGFTMDIPGQSQIDLTFSVTLLDDLDSEQIKTLENIAVIEEETPEVTIKTGKPNIKSSKFVVDENGDGFAEANERLDYTIKVWNTGEVKKANVFIQDDLKDIKPFIKDIADANFMLDGETYPLTDLVNGIELDVEAGALHEITFSVYVKEDFDADAMNQLINIAAVDENTPEASIPSGKAEIIASKDVVDENGNGYAEAGEALTYTLKLKNIGEVEKKHVFIQDKLEDMIAYLQDLSELDMLVNGETKPLTALLDGFEMDILPNEEVEIVFTVTLVDDLDVDAISSLQNIATIDDQTPRKDIPTAKPIIETSKTVTDENGDGYAEAGERLTYEIVVKNSGKVAKKDLLIKDDLADIIDHIDSIDGYEVSYGENTVPLTDLQEGILIDLDVDEMVTFTFDVRVKDDFDAEAVKMLSNLATVGEETPKADIPTGRPDLVVVKEVYDENGNGYAEAGETLSYVITVENRGDVAIKDVLIQDTLSDLLPHIKDPQDHELWLNDEVYTVADLQKGIVKDIAVDEKIYIHFDVEIQDDFDSDDMSELINTVRVNDEEKTAKIPTAKPHLAITKEVYDENQNGMAEQDENLTYVIRVSNNGVVGTDVLIKDDLAEMRDNLQSTRNVKMMVNDTKRPLKDLIKGFNYELGSGETVTITFTVKTKKRMKADLLTNTAYANEHFATVSLPVSLPASKEPNKPEKPGLPIKPNLPFTGMGNEFIYAAVGLLVVGGLLFIVGKRNEKHS